MPILLILMLFAQAPAQAEIYTCTRNGVTTFSDETCGPSASIVRPNVVQPSAEGEKQAKRVTQEMQAISKDLARERLIREKRREIQNRMTEHGRPSAETQPRESQHIGRYRSEIGAHRTEIGETPPRRARGFPGHMQR
ncbi:MAG: DUF4124 domain-containing protein [Pseudomonadota bacterium]